MKRRKSAYGWIKYFLLSGAAVFALLACKDAFRESGAQERFEGAWAQDRIEEPDMQGMPESLDAQGMPESSDAQGTPGDLETQGTPGDLDAQGMPESLDAQGTPGDLETQGTPEVPGMQKAAGESEMQRAPGVSEIRQMAAGAVVDASGLSKEMLDKLFYSSEITEEVRQRIQGISYQENENISLAELRYLRVLHMGFDGESHIGELIVNQAVAEDILEIMAELYRQSYPIEKMLLVDEYGADDERSMADNNTSAFNYREIAGSSRLSNHAKGLAIDINPLYNPYVKQTGDGERLVSPSNGEEFADRSSDFPYKMDGNDLCSQLFLEHGFTWGGNWESVKDYQHFEYGG